MEGFLAAVAVSFGVIFVAETGDKSQLMAMTFAARYRPGPVLVGITLATTVTHAISVAVGHGLGASLPVGWIGLVAGVSFLAFAAWSLRGDSLSAEEREKAERSRSSAVVAASVAFFLAELGDKTMLATIVLSTQHGWAGTWLGSTLGMVAADAVAIALGAQLGRRLPDRVVRLGSATLFGVFGAVLLVDAGAELRGTTPEGLLAAVIDHHAAGWIALGFLVGLLAAVWTPRRRRDDGVGGTGRPAAATVLGGLAAAGGLVAAVLVGADVIQPWPPFDDPRIAVAGLACGAVGMALTLRGRQVPTGVLAAVGGMVVMVPTWPAAVSAALAVGAVTLDAVGTD